MTIDRAHVHLAYRAGTHLAATYPGCVRIDDTPPEVDGPWEVHAPEDCPHRAVDLTDEQAQAVEDLARAAENETDPDLASVYRATARAVYADRGWFFDSEADSLIAATLRHARRHHGRG